MLVLPRVKEWTEREGSFALGSELRYAPGRYGEETLPAVRLLQESLSRREISLRPCGAQGALRFERISHTGTEYYELDVMPERVTVRYTSPLAARDAAATLIGMAVSSGGKLRVPCGTARDWADSRYRGYMMDVARQYVEPRQIRLRIRELALARFNVLHLHLLDTERYAIRSRVFPQLNSDPIFRQYTPEQIRELADYAASLGVTVIPELDLPGHGLYLLERMPELKCRVGGEPAGIWDLCVSNEKCYAFIDALVEEIAPLFPGEYLHMGGDELSFYDIKDSGYWPAWEQCDSCSALMRERGYRDASDLYCHFVRRVYDIVRAHGKKLMIFNDAIDISRTPDLPRDILIHFWRVAAKTRGPHEGCSMERFLEEGFTVVNSFYEEAYIDDYITEERLKDWHPARRPKTDERYHSRIAGGELCAWGIRNHFSYTVPSGILLFGDRLWNEKPLPVGEEVYASLTRQLLSPEEGFPNVFALLGGGLMPLYGVDKFWRREDVTAGQIAEAIERLTRVLAGGWCESAVLKAFLGCLEDALAKYTLEEEEQKKVPIG